MNRRTPFVLALSGITLAGSLLNPALAKPDGERGGKPERDLTETGCRDVVDGSAVYERDQLVPGLPIDRGDYPDALKEDSGTATLKISLAEVSCTDVKYTATAYSLQMEELSQVSTKGDGVTGTEESQLVFTLPVSDHAENCVYLVVTTRVGKTVIDTAPDALDGADVCDGGSPGVYYK